MSMVREEGEKIIIEDNFYSTDKKELVYCKKYHFSKNPKVLIVLCTILWFGALIGAVKYNEGIGNIVSNMFLVFASVWGCSVL